jgi:hypothetical protein
MSGEAENLVLFLLESQYYISVVLPGLRWCVKWLPNGQKFDIIKLYTVYTSIYNNCMNCWM